MLYNRKNMPDETETEAFGTSEYVDETNNDESTECDKSKSKRKSKRKQGGSGDEDKDSTPFWKKALIAVVILGLLFAIGYYAYKQFSNNSSEPMTKKKSASDANVNNFDLSATLNKLGKMQQRVLNNLSRDVGI